MYNILRSTALEAFKKLQTLLRHCRGSILNRQRAGTQSSPRMVSGGGVAGAAAATMIHVIIAASADFATTRRR